MMRKQKKNNSMFLDKFRGYNSELFPSYASTEGFSAYREGGQPMLKSSLCLGSVSAQPSLLAHIDVWDG